MLIFRDTLWEVACGHHNKNQIPPQFITFLFCKTNQMEPNFVQKEKDKGIQQKERRKTYKKSVLKVSCLNVRIAVTYDPALKAQ